MSCAVDKGQEGIGMRLALRRAVTLIVALTLAFAAFALAPAAAQRDPRPELHIRLQFARPGGLYDPGRFTFASDWFVYASVFNWLVRWKPGTGSDQLEPDLAERWTVSADGLVYTFYLRRGIQFHKDYGE